jgi:hypothetical protein
MIVQKSKQKIKQRGINMKRDKIINDKSAIADTRCRVNSYTVTSRKICRNNCKQYDHQNKKCKLGYGN